METVRIGLAGFGNVGGAVYRHLRQESELLASRFNIRIQIDGIAVRHPRLKRRHGITLPRSLLFQNFNELVQSPKIDIIVELMGGSTHARNLILSSLDKGKPVVTANKAVLALKGPELFSQSRKVGVPIFFEASVAGGIPIIEALREGLGVNRFRLIYGIVNGTCNYILSQMSQKGASFDEALRQAQSLGYAEADPSFDIDGFDAAHKATVLASLASGGCVDFKKVFVEGIRQVTAIDIQFAHQLGYEIKLLAIIREIDSNHLEVRVHPTLIPKGNRLASIYGATNSIMVRGHVVGDVEFSGPGAGGNPTASAVIGDIVQAALFLTRRNSRTLNHSNPITPVIRAKGPHIVPMDHVVSRYYLRLSVTDQPGVMAQISSILGKLRIGISSIVQPEGHQGKSVPLIFMIHDAKSGVMNLALRKIQKLSCIKARSVLFRVEGFDS
jgi:homoserine dehydrogenase